MSASPRPPKVLPGVALSEPLALSDLHRQLGGVLDPGVQARVVHAIADPQDADPRSLAPILAVRALRHVRSSQCVLLVEQTVADRVAPGRRWVHPQARWVLAKLLLRATPPPAPPRHSALAVIEPGVTLGHNVDIGPGAIVLAGACVGDHCTIGPGAVIYGGTRIGSRVVVGPGAILGHPGFGWAHGPDGQVLRIPQLAGVIVDDDVEVGALATVDAGTLRPTRLRCGCRLDAHVHVGHNADIGEHTMVAAQSGFAGSVRVGRGVLVGGQVGVADHAVVGDGARLAGRAGVIGDVPAGQTFAGYPAVERMRWLRAIANLMRGRRL